MIDDNFDADIEKLENFLLLFGLREDYTSDDLSSSFRVLAKLNHPDIKKSDGSEERMISINEGYEFLKDARTGGKLDSLLKVKKARTVEQNRDKRVDDIFYNQYKKGFIILKAAFENYFGESEDKTYVGSEETLRKELFRAKIEFATLINDLPYNQWVNDAIDKINSINKWLS